MQRTPSHARQRILDAARRVFADCGYQGSAVQEIVRIARVTKPTLYYYFGSKAGLYRTVVDDAFDERFKLMQGAAARQHTLREQLVEMLEKLFQFAREHRDLTRITFVTAFAAKGEIPNQDRCFKKGRRNFEFVHSLIKRGVASGELRSRFSARELTTAIFSQILFYAMTQAIQTRYVWKRQRAREVVDLFFEGAGSGRKS